MNGENFVKAVQYLEAGYIIQSSLSDIKIKKIQNNYYYSFEERTEWKLCEDNYHLFRTGEIKNTWYIFANDNEKQ
jgi:hypothetical protein